MSAFQTDALHSSSLPSSTLGRRRPPPTSSSRFDTQPNDTAGPSSNPDVEARERFHEEWNVRIDKEVKALAGGLKEIVDLADIGPNPSAHSSSTTSLHLRLRTAQLIRSAQSLRDMSHELRLMLLLSDEVDTARRRDMEVRAVREELGIRKGRVEKEMKSLMGGTATRRAGNHEKEGAREEEEAKVGGNEVRVDDEVEEVIEIREDMENVSVQGPGLNSPDRGYVEENGDNGSITRETQTAEGNDDDDDDDDFEEV